MSTPTHMAAPDLINLNVPPATPPAGESLITITASAAAKINELIAKEGDAEYGLRMRVIGGGCSGLQYQMAIEETPAENDNVFTSNGVKVFVDTKSAPFLAGVEIDYLNGLMESGFKVSNPNAQTTCGCGQSFR